MTKRQVLILIGSDSDAPTMQKTVELLNEFGIASHMTVASAHRSPERVHRLVEEAKSDGVKVFIVGAGAAAHLAGMVASSVTQPVIGVPIDSSPLKGWDALLATRSQSPLLLLLEYSRGKNRYLLLMVLFRNHKLRLCIALFSHSR